ncbi:MAG: hypothetical protein QNK35_15995, partial [Bacteroides sp.]|nr:hypothetical protein [Bacteroides sp.]
MEEGKKKKLVKLPPEVLADALLKMTEHDDMAKRLVERLISEPDVIIKSFRRKISGLKRRKKVIHKKESRRFAAELDHLL